MGAGRGRGARRALAPLVALALLVAACIGGDGGDDPGPEPGPPATTMRVGLGGPVIVDPVEASLASASDLMVLDLLHDGLTRVDADGVPQPALASAWTADARFTAFEFTLDPEATFTSGRAIAAVDVVTSLERVMAGGDSSLPALSLEAVKGFRAFADGSAEHVSGLTAPAPGTVRFELTTPLSVLPVVLSDPILSVVDEATITGDLADLDLSGGWSVEAAAEGVLQLANRDADASLASVELRPHDDPEAAYDAFDDGDVDWAPVPPERYEAAVEDYGDDHFAPYQAELFFGMNVSSPALASLPLRQAIAMAIDRDAIVDAVYAELAEPLTAIVPAGVPGHDPDRCPSCAYDPEKAANLVLYAHGDAAPAVHIDYDDSAVQQTMAEMVAADLEAAGIPTVLRGSSLEDYKAFVVSGQQELFSFGWIGAYRSPDAYLAPLFGSAANDNLTSFRSERVDELLAAARASSDSSRRARWWAEAERLVLEAAVVVPIAQFRIQAVVNDRVQGFEQAVDGTVDWSVVSLGG